MQVSSNHYNYSVYQNQSGGKSKAGNTSAGEDFRNFANYGDTNNTIFQNLLKNPTVQDNVSVDEDGTYSFSFDGKRPLSLQEWLAKSLIDEQNSTHVVHPGQQTPYSVDELAHFRQLTGYNLIQINSTEEGMGIYTLADDVGNPPSGAGLERAQAIWEAFDLAKGTQDLTSPGAELTKQDLLDAITVLRNAPGADTDLYDTLFDMVTKSWPDEAET